VKRRGVDINFFEKELSWIAQTLKMVAASSSETAVNYLPVNIQSHPEDLNLHQHQCKNLHLISQPKSSSLSRQRACHWTSSISECHFTLLSWLCFI